MQHHRLILPTHAEMQHPRIRNARRENKEVIVQVVVRVEACMLIQPPRSTGGPAGLMRAVDEIKPVLQIDSAIVNAPVQTEAAFSEVVPQIESQVCHAGLARVTYI